MSDEYINPAALVAPPGGIYTHVVRANGMLFISGQLGRDAQGRAVGPDVASQYRQAWSNVCRAVEAAGGTPADIVKTTTYVAGEGLIPAVRDVRAELCGSHPPASTMIVVAALAAPGFLVEIDAIAVPRG